MIQRLIVIMASVYVLCFVLVTASAGFQNAGLSTPPTISEITNSIGTAADAQAVLSIALAHAMAQSHREFVLARQIPKEWLPQLPRLEVVRLSDIDAARLLEACGVYWAVERVRRTGDLVSVRLNKRCGGVVVDYLVLYNGHEWTFGPPARADGQGWGPGLGSGVSSPSAECPCSGRF